VSSSSTETTTLVTVEMPQMGVSVAEGTIVEWKKRPGDWIEADESIVQIDTDKIETEIPSPATGRVKEIMVDVGQTVDVGTALATIETDAKPGEAHADEHHEESSVVSRQSSGAQDGGAAEKPPPVSPVVQRIAQEHDVDLSKVEGTGRRGRVTKKDLVAYIEAGGNGSPPAQAEPAEPKPEPALHMESPYKEEEPEPAAKPAPEPEPAPAPAAAAVDGGQELSLMRRRIGEHMVRSLQTAAHCTTMVEADMSRIEAARGRLSYLPFVARAVIGALREFPTLNATLAGDRLTVHEEVNLGIAVSLGEEGLIVPVVHNAHELSHEGLGARIKDLAKRARAKELTPDEVSGGTFTITNPGFFGALLATPIINQPQVAILDLEAVVKRPVVVTDANGNDSIAIRPMTYLCMSWDHRALDGALAAQFLSAVRRNIEEWRS
jgi:pyruvate/2-oxoglutarate dehydrogenase complex dihydrolipoamide acyltransferase (E2) component